MPLTDEIESRLCVPSTPTELAALFDRPVSVIRATLFNLKKAGRVERLDKAIKLTRRPEHLWQRKYLQELV